MLGVFVVALLWISFQGRLISQCYGAVEPRRLSNPITILLYHFINSFTLTSKNSISNIFNHKIYKSPGFFLNQFLENDCISFFEDQLFET